MKCNDVILWLYESDDLANLPPEVADHLCHCEQCNTEHQNLMEIEALAACEEANSTVGAMGQRAMSKFLDQLPHQLPHRLPPPAPVVAPPPRPPAARATAAEPRQRDDRRARGRRRLAFQLGGIAAAALLAFSAGRIYWTAGDTNAALTNPTMSDANVQADNLRSAARVADLGQPGDGNAPLVEVLLQHALTIATEPEEEARFAQLVDLTEVIGRQMQSSHDENEKESLGRLYEVLMSGVARVAARGEGPAVKQRIAKSLNAFEPSSQQPDANSVPAAWAASPPRAVSALDDGEALPALSLPADDLLSTVVNCSIRMTAEDDPLERATQSNILAEHLSHHIVATAGEGKPDDFEALGEILGGFLAGVDGNLEKEPNDKKAKAVLAGRKRAEDVLESNLATAPPAAREGLQRAIEAKSRGKGWRRFGKLPPGLQRKLDKQHP